MWPRGSARGSTATCNVGGLAKRAQELSFMCIGIKVRVS